jgi:hypothetical protein
VLAIPFLTHANAAFWWPVFFALGAKFEAVHSISLQHYQILRRGNSITRSGGGGVMASLGGVHPCLRQMACTSEPDVHLKSFNGTDG